ncbi:MAG: DUF2281 domain-containing protein [Cyanobacteriota bacterium]|nr:DUF2281 domain-containing protein [Cyanobacteriota bacterium]
MGATCAQLLAGISFSKALINMYLQEELMRESVKERLLQEIEQLPDDLLTELLDVALLIKQRQEASDLPMAQRKKSQVKVLQGWFEKMVPAPADFDEDEAKWEYLRAKHNL